MRDAKQTLEQYFPEMRWRCLSLAADLDRIERSPGSAQVMGDPRLALLKQAIAALSESSGPMRAERVQMIFSDKTPPPAG